MSETLTLLLAWVGGVGLGAFFFGGLWWTIRRALSSPRPGLWLVSGFVVRTSVTLSGLHLISGPHLDRLLLAIFGFVVARHLLTAATRSSGEVARRPRREARHAP